MYSLPVEVARTSCGKHFQIVKVLTAAIAAILTLSSSGGTQAAPVKQADAPRCFRGRPLPRCKTFVLFELGYNHRLLGSEQVIRNTFVAQDFRDRDLQGYLALDMGLMVNTDSTHAKGATVQLGIGGEGPRIALKGRKRIWMSQGSSTLDFSAGVLAARVRGATVPSPRIMAVGLTGGVGVNIFEYAGIALSGDIVRGGGRTAHAVHGGVKLGSYPAVAGTVLVTAWVIFLIAALGGAGT